MFWYYTTINELPVWNWHQILNSDESEKHRLRKLRKFRFRTLWDDQKMLARIWKDLERQFIDRFGFAGEFLAIEKKRMQIDRLILQHLITDDPTLITIIEIRKTELQQLISKTQSIEQTPFDEQVVILESHFKIPIDIHTTPVSKFYTYIEVLNREAKKFAENA